MAISSTAASKPDRAPIRNLLFDLDGTLTDPAAGIVGSARHALAKLGRPAPDDLHWIIGPPLRDSFATLLGTDDPALVERAIAAYRERFGTVGLFENEVYEGIAELLAAERAAGRRLYVATSKPHVYATRIVERFGLAPLLDKVYGAELDGTRSVKGELLAWLLAHEGIDPAATVLVGDRHHDVEGARANGLRTIGVLYGYGTPEELAAARPTWTCATVAGLAAFLRETRAW